MGYLIKQNQTAQPLVFLMVDAADHVTPKTGLSPTVTISKNGGSFASPAGAVTEIANGWYKVAGNATDTNTLGPLLLHATASGADPTDDRFDVVAFDPQTATNLGLSALPTAAAGASGGLPLAIDSSGRVDVGKWLGGTVATPNVTGVPIVDVGYVAGDAATVESGNLDVNVVTIASQTVTATADVNADNLANLDAKVSTRSTLAAADIRTAVGLASANLDTQLGTIQTTAAAILDDTGTSGVVVAAGSKTGYELAAAGLDGVTVETGLNARQSLSIIAAAVAGLGGATSNLYKGAGVATTRISFTAADGERTAVTLTPPA